MQHNPILQLALQQAMRTNPSVSAFQRGHRPRVQGYAVLRQFKPLAIGVHEVLISELPQFDPVVVQRVIQRHCSTARYLKAMQREGFRYHLTGKRAAELTDLERDDAKRRLDAMAGTSRRPQKMHRKQRLMPASKRRPVSACRSSRTSRPNLANSSR